MPIYYRNKIYSDDHKETLWINKINKKERWILGQRIKIDTKEGLDNYYKLLEDSQAKNKRLGYGDDKINWDLKIYQNEMRLLKQYERGVKHSEYNPVILCSPGIGSNYINTPNSKLNQFKNNKTHIVTGKQIGRAHV